MDIALILIAIIGGAVGIFTSLYCAVSLVATIIWKFYRKVKYHTSMFD